jgi:hypothetical protein
MAGFKARTQAALLLAFLFVPVVARAQAMFCTIDQ